MQIAKDGKDISSPSELPNVECYGLLKATTTDDGYGGRTPAITLTVYATKEDLEHGAFEAQRRYGSFRAIRITPATVQNKVSVTF